MTQAVRSAHSFAQNANVWGTRQVAIEPVTEAQARIARQAYRDFGKTSGHRAKLNFGDCFSYALAKAKGEPLLFKDKTSRGRM